MNDDFDPDKFLAETEPVEEPFDPDKFLAETEPVPEEVNDLEYIGSTASDIGEGLLSGLANAPLTKIIGSGISAAIDPLTDVLTNGTDKELEAQGFNIQEEDKSFLDRYYDAKDAIEKQAESAAESSPGATLAGQVGGGIAEGVAGGNLIGGILGPVSKGSKLTKALQAARDKGGLSRLAATTGEAAAGGAAFGALEGESETLRGDLKGTAKDIGEGALFGGGVGLGLGTLGSIGRGVKKVASESETLQDLLDSYRYGKRGVQLRNPDDVGREILEGKGLAQSISDDIRTKTRELGKQFDEIESSDASVNIKDRFTNFFDDINKLPNVTDEARKDVKKLKNFVSKLEGDLGNLSPAEARQVQKGFKDLVTDFDGQSALKNDEFKDLARRSSEDISKDIQDQLEHLGPLNEKYTNYLDLKGSTRIVENLKKNKIEDQIDSFTDKILHGNDPVNSKNAFLKFQRFSEKLKKTDPDLFEQITPKINDTQRKYQLATKAAGGRIKTSTNLGAAVLGSVESLGVKGANYIGELSKDPSLITPIINKIEKIGGSASNFISPLQKAAAADPRKRTAIMYGLYQQPGFRSILEREESEESEDE